MSITFFGKFSIFCLKFSGEVPVEDLFFFGSPAGFFRRISSSFSPKIGENDLLHLRKNIPKREKAYHKMGETIPQNGRKSHQNFLKQGGLPPPPPPPPPPGRAATENNKRMSRTLKIRFFFAYLKILLKKCDVALIKTHVIKYKCMRKWLSTECIYLCFNIFFALEFFIT